MIFLYPGETDGHQFIIPFPAEEVEKVMVSYKQHCNVVLNVETTELENTEDGESTFTIPLSQEDTLKFNGMDQLNIQLNVLLKNGDRRTSNIIELYTGDQFYRHIMDGTISEGSE